ncbi:MAG: hypothetical protein R2707_01700 [Acidimicrobiales bacterium]
MRMTHLAPTPATVRRLVVALFVAGAAILTASPASAQYGGAVDLFVDPTRVEIDGTFDYFGSNCPAGSTVSITIDGIPGVLATTIAFDDSSYAGTAVAMPSGVVAGQDYTVRASCAGNSDTAVIRAVCNGGTDPVDGACPDGQTVGGQDPTATTTTTPGSGGNGGTGGTGGDDATGGNGGSGGGAGSSPDLAVTGARFAEQAVRIGITLVAFGAIVLLAATTRRERATV